MNRLLGIVAVSGWMAVGMAQAQSVVSESTSAAPTTPIQPAQPSPAENDPDIALDPASLLPDLPPLPPAKATLIGGTVERLDRVQDQLTLRVFGGGKMSVLFDTRTHIIRDGNPGSLADLKQGENLYVDTMLDNGKVFARNIRLRTSTAQGETQGVLVSYRPDKSELVIQDPISPKPLKLRVTPETQVVRENHPTSASNLLEGSLIAVTFATSQNGHDRDTVRQVSILASRGEMFTFVGRVITLDLRSNLLVITSSINHKTYEIVLNSSMISIADNLREGAAVTVTTQFEGNRYVARNLIVNSTEK
jgi:hypothetical protein